MPKIEPFSSLAAQPVIREAQARFDNRTLTSRGVAACAMHLGAYSVGFANSGTCDATSAELHE
jgi:hypothetical protein